jgi:hypothetical protein
VNQHCSHRQARLDYRDTVSSSDLATAARLAIVDGATAELVERLRSAGLRCLLLKGPGFSSWLYDRAEVRPYGDTDVLVDPAQRPRVEQLLEGLGYARVLSERDVPSAGTAFHSDTWRRQRDGSTVDLHRTLNGARAPDERAWEALSRTTERLRVGSVEVEIPGLPAQALHAALHAAYHGARSGKPVEDLRRALARAPNAAWTAADELAREIDATDAFAAGLRLVPEGRAVAAALGLETPRSVEVELRAGADPPLAASFEWLAQAPGLRAKASLCRRLLFPSAAWVRESYPFAYSGRAALAAAYLVRLLRVPRYGLQALVAWRRTRRIVRSRGH